MSETSQALARAANFMPAMEIADAIARHNAIVTFTKTVMVEGTDFGTIPGTDKPTLLKAGAEKLNTLFGLSSHFTITEKELDWTGSGHSGEPFFYFVYRCQLYRGDLLIAEADGSCNSMEKKYRFRWLPAHEARRLGVNLDAAPTAGGRVSEFDFAVEKAETSGKYGKPAAYWQQFRDAITTGTAKRVKKTIRDGSERDAWEIDQTLYRVPNPDVADQVNTIQKMAQKRALVAATLLAVNASEFFTQDVEDMEVIEGSYTVRPETSKAQPDKKDPQPGATQPGVTQPGVTQPPANGNGSGTKLEELVKQAQALIDKPPASLSSKEVDTIKANWTKLFETARNEGAPLSEAVKADAKWPDYLRAIVKQGGVLIEFRRSVAQSEQLAQKEPTSQAGPDISDWTGGAK